MTHNLNWEEREDRFERKYRRATIGRPDRVIYVWEALRRPTTFTVSLTPTDPKLKARYRGQVNRRWMRAVADRSQLDAAIDELLALRLAPPPPKSRRTGWRRA